MSDVDIKVSRSFWSEYLTSQEVSEKLMTAAESVAARAESRIGTPSQPRALRNPNFGTQIAVRHGKDGGTYCVGLVIAANPRSIYKALHDGALDT